MSESSNINHIEASSQPDKQSNPHPPASQVEEKKAGGERGAANGGGNRRRAGEAPKQAQQQ
jgi:hypothetical protein